ncbi:RluA family pseudouridine synthase [Streptococcus sp. DD12]|uniref:RluA family pseudouridine synthase n=1 Tax=Streptococcus sp. DD12 TaxID=1777880 RepID=UPI00079BB423|nr:RluA family pseudouridine synthase [Streptococcus sp. DD12]KXT75493.1 hypothetical protein STRDD12_01304 [Streptococcus sp. DD12]
MTMHITFSNPYPPGSLKTLLEDHLLIPRKIRHFLRTKKHVLVNGQHLHWQSLVRPGDQIELFFDAADYPKRDLPFGQADLVQAVYEDDHIIIVNKPEGMKTHGNAPGEVALLNHVSAYVGQVCHVVHRLDKETSGLVLFAKTPFILPILGRLLESKAIQRDYWALVEGCPPKSLTVTAPIGRHRHDRRKRVVDPKNGDWARTRFSRLKNQAKVSLLRCQLDSGRTHQIRVHLSHKGFPIIGDPLYSQHQAPRLMLHAYRLRLTHPLTAQVIDVQADSLTFENQLQHFLPKN